MKLDPKRLEALDRALPVVLQPGPQLEAFKSEADVLLFGGAAGGGKSFLALWLALYIHTRSLIIRREAVQLQPMIEELATIIGNRDGYNGSEHVWRLPDRQIQFGGCANAGDERRYQGNPRDLLVIDEAANVLEEQVRYLQGWNRSTKPGQRVRTLLCSNPPASAEGEWLVQWFAPWLDPTFPNPARPGELRWFAVVDGQERWVDGPAPFQNGKETIRPLSRTFIPSRVTDNAYLRDTNYLAQLQALPEPLRSQLLNGDFLAGRKDDAWQVIPSAWITEAMARSDGGAGARGGNAGAPGAPSGVAYPAEAAGVPPRVGSRLNLSANFSKSVSDQISAIGVDPSRGGRDEAIIAVRRGWRFDDLISVPAAEARSGAGIATRVLQILGDSWAPVTVDAVGIGASVVDHLEAFLGAQVHPFNGAGAANDRDGSGTFGFANARAASWWAMRELLDPSHPIKIALPRDTRLFADLTAPRYRVTARGIQVELKEGIISRLGRSPDRGDAVVLAALRRPTLVDHTGRLRQVRVRRAYEPKG